jgi:serine/threonine protein phosphatase PrpC
MKYIILACDGLWDVVSNQDAIDFVNNEIIEIERNKKIENIHEKRLLNNIAYKLVNYAYKKGSSDNISVLIIFI